MTTRELIKQMTQEQLDALTTEEIDKMRSEVISENAVPVATDIANEALKDLGDGFMDPATGRFVDFSEFINAPKNEAVRYIFLAGVTAGMNAGMYNGETILAELLDGTERLPLFARNKGGQHA